MASPVAAVSNAVTIKELTVVLGSRKVLDIPSFAINRNEVLVIVGPNGSGKSTFVLCLAKLLRPTTGSVSYSGAGENLSSLHLRRQLAVVFQDPYLLNRTVRDNVALGLRLRGVKSKNTAGRVDKWLNRFGVLHLADRQARALSGGEAKRVSLARAFAMEPQTLFLDEPFSALDTPTRQGLLEDFQIVLRETRMTTVLVTHDHNEALALADRVAVMIDGHVRQVGPPEEIFTTPADEGIAGFIESGNLLQGVIVENQKSLASVRIADKTTICAVSDLPANTKVTLFLPYDDVTLLIGDAPGTLSSARNQLKGTIVKTFPQGSQLKITLDCGFPLSSLITHRSWEELGLDIGREVTASFKASALHLIPRL